MAAPGPTWFDDIKTPLDLKDRDGEVLVQFAAARLRDPGGPLNYELPAHLASDTQPRIVVVSYTGGDKGAVVRVGAGRGVIDAIEQATLSGPKVAPEQSRWLKLDIVRTVRNAQSRWTGDTIGIANGEGVALTRQSRVVLTWEQLKAAELVTEQLRFDPHDIPEGAAANADGSRPVHFFTCDSFYTDGTQVRTTRHDDWIEPGSATQADFDLAIALAGDYLKRAVGKDGKFVYLANPTGRPSTPVTAPGAVPPEEQYNIVRHAGAILALVYAYEADGKRDQGMRDALVRSIGYMLAAVKPASALKDADVIVENDLVRLGGNGLGVNAIARYTKATGDAQFVPAVKRLANWVVQTQGPHGNYTIHEQRYSDGLIIQTSSLYAPGEAMWGLAELHDLDPTGPWLNSAAEGVDYMVTTRDPGVTDDMKYVDHWMLYAIEHVVSRGRKDQQWTRHAQRMVATVTRTQIEPSIEHPGWAGAYTRPPNANETATRVEGLCSAFRFFSATRPASPEIDRVRRSIEPATRFQFRQQFLIPQAMYYPQPLSILGGFRSAPNDARVRIDSLQHGIVSLIGAREILFRR